MPELHDAAAQRLIEGDYLESSDAAEFFRKNPRPEDLEVFIAAFAARSELVLRLDIVDLIGLLDSPEVCGHLMGIAKSRAHYLVRYFAIRNLIELDCEGWKPESARKLNTDFYASLLAYERYLSDEIDLDELHATARRRGWWNGDHWGWLTHIKPSPEDEDESDEPEP